MQSLSIVHIIRKSFSSLGRTDVRPNPHSSNTFSDTRTHTKTRARALRISLLDTCFTRKQVRSNRVGKLCRVRMDFLILVHTLFCYSHFTKNTFLTFFYKNIWSIQKKAVTLHRQIKNNNY